MLGAARDACDFRRSRGSIVGVVAEQRFADGAARALNMRDENFNRRRVIAPERRGDDSVLIFRHELRRPQASKMAISIEMIIQSRAKSLQPRRPAGFDQAEVQRAVTLFPFGAECLFPGLELL